MRAPPVGVDRELEWSAPYMRRQVTDANRAHVDHGEVVARPGQLAGGISPLVPVSENMSTSPVAAPLFLSVIVEPERCRFDARVVAALARKHMPRHAQRSAPDASVM